MAMSMISSEDTILIFGGSGFIGSYLVKELAKTHAKIMIICRTPESHLELKVCGAVGQISLMKINISDSKAVEAAVRKSSYVINLIGSMREGKRSSFADLHVTLAHTIAKAAHKYGIKRLVHISALGVDKALTSRYARSKLEGEGLVLKAFHRATVLRPSAVFGAEDNFTNLINRVAKTLPVIPLINGGYTKIQPIFVVDLAKSIIAALQLESSEVIGRVLELCGPKVYYLHGITSYILKLNHKKRIFVYLPFSIAKWGAMLLQLLSSSLLNLEQVELLKYDNVLQSKNGLKVLGIRPTPMEVVLPQYIY